MACNLILTQLDEIWKTTSIFLNMEDDLNFLLIEDDHNYFQIEDDLNILIYGRQPQHSCKLKKTTICVQMEDALNILVNGRRPVRIT